MERHGRENKFLLAFKYQFPDRWIFENPTLKALNIPFLKVVLPGRVKCGGSEGEIVVAHGCRKGKKANMSPGRGKNGGSWPPAFPYSHSGYIFLAVKTISPALDFDFLMIQLHIECVGNIYV